MSENKSSEILAVLLIVGLVVGAGAGYFLAPRREVEVPDNRSLDDKIREELLRKMSLSFTSYDGKFYEIEIEGREFIVMVEEVKVIGFGYRLYFDYVEVSR